MKLYGKSKYFPEHSPKMIFLQKLNSSLTTYTSTWRPPEPAERTPCLMARAFFFSRIPPTNILCTDGVVKEMKVVVGRFARDQGVTKRMCLSWLTNSTLVYEPKCGGRWGVAGSQPMSTAVNRSPNKLWKSNSIFKGARPSVKIFIARIFFIFTP